MKYSVNKIKLKESSWTKDFIGLFRGTPECTGEGNFCGYYAIEYFNHAFLLAQYSRESEDQGAKVYNSKGQPHTEESIVKKYIKKIPIGSGMWTKTFEAKDDEEAIRKFFAEEY